MMEKRFNAMKTVRRFSEESRQSGSTAERALKVDEVQ